MTTVPMTFIEWLRADPNLHPVFVNGATGCRVERVSGFSDVKREEIEADARSEDLWLARGGEA